MRDALTVPHIVAKAIKAEQEGIQELLALNPVSTTMVHAAVLVGAGLCTVFAPIPSHPEKSGPGTISQALQNCNVRL